MKKLIVGNWKMNLNVNDSSLYVAKLAEMIQVRRDVEVVLCPNMLALQPLSLQVNHRQFKLGAQNCYWRDEGAFTGEVSANMLRGLAQYVLVGHSERRNIFAETDRDIRFKTQAIVRNGMRPILCVGETSFERSEGDTMHVLNDQVVSGLLNIASDELDEVVIAYEPVWAIGTGESANPKDVSDAASIIRSQVTQLYGKGAGDSIQILYGGSVDHSNAASYLRAKGIDGLLVGGASLRANEFSDIIKTTYEVTRGEA